MYHYVPDDLYHARQLISAVNDLPEQSQFLSKRWNRFARPHYCDTCNFVHNNCNVSNCYVILAGCQS